MPIPTSDCFKNLVGSVASQKEAFESARLSMERLGKSMTREAFNHEYLSEFSWSKEIDESHKRALEGIRGKQATMVIVDDPLISMPGMTITQDGTMTLEMEQLKAADLEIDKVPGANRTLKFHGGTVTVKLTDGTYRKTPVPPQWVVLRDAYQGKKLGTILVMELPHTLALSGPSAKKFNTIEIPLQNAYDFFGIPDLDKVLSRVKSIKGKPSENLYHKDLTHNLPDFGAF